jgi:phosphoribosylaminoimidazole carboxylase (NCAIR synthetase)
MSHGVTTPPYEDAAALRAFARTVDVVTYEFENVPAEALDLHRGRARSARAAARWRSARTGCRRRSSSPGSACHRPFAAV